MERTKNTIRLTESEFNQLVEASVIAVLNEGKFGDFAKKVGKGLGKAALAGACATGALYTADQGLDSMERYEDELNGQATELQGPSEDEITKFLRDHNMPDTESNREDARQYFIEFHGSANESRSRRLSQIIREEISKVL